MHGPNPASHLNMSQSQLELYLKSCESLDNEPSSSFVQRSNFGIILKKWLRICFMILEYAICSSLPLLATICGSIFYFSSQFQMNESHGAFDPFSIFKIPRAQYRPFIFTIAIVYVFLRFYFMVALAMLGFICFVGVLFAFGMNCIFHKINKCEYLVYSLIVFLKKMQLCGLSRDLTHPLPPIISVDDDNLDYDSFGTAKMFTCRRFRTVLHHDLLSLLFSILAMKGSTPANFAHYQTAIPSCKLLGQITVEIFEVEIVSAAQEVVAATRDPLTCWQNDIMQSFNNLDDGFASLNLAFYVKDMFQILLRLLSLSFGTICRLSGYIFALHRIVKLLCLLTTFDKKMKSHLGSKGLEYEIINKNDTKFVSSNDKEDRVSERIDFDRLELVKKLATSSKQLPIEPCPGEEHCGTLYLKLRKDLVCLRQKLESMTINIVRCECLLAQRHVIELFMDPILGHSRAPLEKSFTGIQLEHDSLAQHNADQDINIDFRVFSSELASANEALGQLRRHIPTPQQVALIQHEMQSLQHVMDTLSQRCLYAASELSTRDQNNSIQDSHTIFREGPDVTSINSPQWEGNSPAPRYDISGVFGADGNVERNVPNYEISNPGLDCPIDVFVGEVSASDVMIREAMLREEVLRRRNQEHDVILKDNTVALMKELSTTVLLRSSTTKAREREQSEQRPTSECNKTELIPNESTAYSSIKNQDFPATPCQQNSKSFPPNIPQESFERESIEFKPSMEFLSILRLKKLANDQHHTIGDSDELDK